MFTGIVQACVPIESAVVKPGLLTISLKLPPYCADNVQIGASIAINGVCLTVTDWHETSNHVEFDIMQQTLEVSHLSELKNGCMVNIERSATMNAEVGGHILSGHVDQTAEVVAIHETDNNKSVTYRFDASLSKYLFDKGFVALNGCSLTIAAIDKERAQFTVAYIPETLRSTNHGQQQVGSILNLELDRQTQTTVDTVERVLAEMKLKT